jgi:hypothetical protein
VPLPYHRAHLKLGVARGNLKQTCRLRSFQNIVELDAAASVFRFHYTVKFGINPDIALLAFA